MRSGFRPPKVFGAGSSQVGVIYRVNTGKGRARKTEVHLALVRRYKFAKANAHLADRARCVRVRKTYPVCT